MAQGRAIWRRIGVWLVWTAIAILLVASFLPLVETDMWWVRMLDFPRLHILVALLVLLPIGLILARASRMAVAGLVLGAVAVVYHAVQLWPYTPLAREMAVAPASCAPGSRFDLMVANVQKKNENAGPLLDAVNEADPDLLLVLETDAWWDQRLAPIAEAYPHGRQFIPDDHGAYGMHFFSRHQLVSADMRFLFDEFTPTLQARIRLPGGGLVELLGLHPRPPYPSQSSTMRDAHLLMMALEARASDLPTVYAGDLNAVPWERVTRRAMRLGGLLDPRVGRGYYPTIGAERPLVSWPLDQVLHEASFAPLALEVLPAIDSDHYPYRVTLCFDRDLAARHEAPTPEPGDAEEARATIAAARELALE